MKTASEDISSWFHLLGCSIKSVAKIMLQSGKSTVTPVAQPHGSIIVMGNGPSLSETISRHSDILHSHPLLAVNFAANSPEFFTLKPRYYVLADPYFFNSADNPNVKKLNGNISSIGWDMTLFLPTAARKCGIGFANSHVTVKYFNAVGIEGFKCLENLAFRKGLGMPRPRNVLIPSLMIAMALGYKEIYITGADHSWTRTLSVNENNEVISIQPHFYKDDEKEETRVKTEYLKYPLHRIIFSFYVAFKSYFTIERYARHRNVRIYNATPGSFIDAFERKPLTSIPD